MSAKREVDAIREASGKCHTRVPGHALPWEGAGVKCRDRLCRCHEYGRRLAHSRCSCGLFSPLLSSSAHRQAWHRQHKLDVLADNPTT